MRSVFLLGLVRFGFRGADVALGLVEQVAVDGLVEDASAGKEGANEGLLPAVTGGTVVFGGAIATVGSG